MKAVGTAPGRLDVLGGVADYSGSLVLETPTVSETRVTVEPGNERTLRFKWKTKEGWDEYELPAELLQASDWSAFTQELRSSQVPKPVLYLAGCCLAAKAPPKGLNLWVESDVPESMGVSSSAALEVATLRALFDFQQTALSNPELARLAQAVENKIVGAPCGIMDQLASVFGERGALLPIRCRPDTLLSPVPLPTGLMVIGWPSGVQHDVAGSPYATARAAAFMGKKWIEEVCGQQWSYTAEIPLETATHGELPEQLNGQTFLARFRGVDDPLSVIDPEQEYPVRDATLFPIRENLRAETILEQLQRGEAPAKIGEALYASHEDYGRIGLGNPATDRMVQAVCRAGVKQGFYGARISGGGCGGTVVVLMEQEALPNLEKLSKKLEITTSLIA